MYCLSIKPSYLVDFLLRMREEALEVVEGTAVEHYLCLVIRAGHLLSAVTHGFLAYWAIRLMLASREGSKGGP